jgi:penicillin-insensitive murein DD-endopeptidase
MRIKIVSKTLVSSLVFFLSFFLSLAGCAHKASTQNSVEGIGGRVTKSGRTPQALESDINPWSLSRSPTAQERAEAIGFYSSGCLVGGRTLPLSTSRWEIVNPQRRRNYSHSKMEEFLNFLGKWSAEDSKIGKIIVGDIAQPTGGPMFNGHASHQTGLDADLRIALWPRKKKMKSAQRQNLSDVSVAGHIAKKTKDGYKLQSEFYKKYWRPQYAELISKAASFSDVERIFVSPPIKTQVCRHFSQSKKSLKGSKAQRNQSLGQSLVQLPEWLLKIRPYAGHTGHFHVRLKCPKKNLKCVPQGEVVKDPTDITGVGCSGDELASWYEKDNTKNGFLKNQAAELSLAEATAPVDQEKAKAELWTLKLEKMPLECRALASDKFADAK